MTRFLLPTLLLLSSLAPALAQRLVTQTATLAAGQGVFLDLKYAHTIRVRPGTGLRVEARVVINDNEQNDLYSLGLEKGGNELSVIEKLDEEKLRESHYTGDCEGVAAATPAAGCTAATPAAARRAGCGLPSATTGAGTATAPKSTTT